MPNEKIVKTNIVALLLGANDVLDREADKDLITKTVKDFAKENFLFSVKDLFVSSVAVNI